MNTEPRGSLPSGLGISGGEGPTAPLGSPVWRSIALLGKCGGGVRRWVCDQPSRTGKRGWGQLVQKARELRPLVLASVWIWQERS